MDWKATYARALPYVDFLDRYATSAHRERWQAVYHRVTFTDAQRTLLGGFEREMRLFCLAGTWCGDCVLQCPILARAAEESARLDVRFLDRDEHPQVRDILAINQGHRIPFVVFLSEDFVECARYGERTLSVYRKIAHDRLGPACPTGVLPPASDHLAAVLADWLGEVERIQLLLRLSPRLRALHGD